MAPFTGILHPVFAALAALAWAAYLADFGPNETQVALAFIGAFSSTLTAFLVGRERRDRKVNQQRQADAIKAGGLVAMVPEQVVRDVQAAAPPPPAPGDQAP